MKLDKTIVALCILLAVICVCALPMGAQAQDALVCNTDANFSSEEVMAERAAALRAQAAMTDGLVGPGSAESASLIAQAGMLEARLDGGGILTTIAREIQEILDSAYEALYQGILASRFPAIVSALMVLYVAIFGIMFTLGMVQTPLNEVVKRVVKMVIVSILVSPGGLEFFNQYVYRFFRGGMEFLIAEMVSLMAGYIDPGSADSLGAVSLSDGTIGPFTPLDKMIMDLVSPQTMMIFEAAANSGPYGAVYLAVIAMGSIFLLAAIGRALWVYLIALIATSFLFGLAPIFISMILFQRTKNLFDGWLGQVINFTLQPVLMFTFLGFFVILMQTAMEDLLAVQVCYGPVESPIAGTAYEPIGLQFTDETGAPLLVEWSLDGPECVINGETMPCENAPPFPIDLVDILTFVLLGYIAFQFYNHVTEIANDISGSFINLEIESPVQGAIDQVSGAMDKGLKAAASGAGAEGAMKAVIGRSPISG